MSEVLAVEAPEETKAVIVVNGRQRAVDSRAVTYDEVVRLAFPDPPPGNEIMYDVMYRNSAGDRSGTLPEGGSVEVKREGTIFDVQPTHRS